MIRTLVNKFLKAALDELFVDAGNVQLSMGTDVFTNSSIDLKNLTLRPDIFDVCLQPLKLVSGHVGKICIDGVAELALGGKLRCQIENVFLMFAVDTNVDAERVQILKKILLELQSSQFPHALIRDILKKVQGYPIGKEPDMKKKRRLLLKALSYIFGSMIVTIRTVHVRFEIPSCSSNGGKFLNSSPRHSKISRTTFCSAIGFTLPMLKIASGPGSTIRVDSSGKDIASLNINVKTLQVYCDYDCESYVIQKGTTADILQDFLSKWKTEVHTALLLPFDIDITLTIEVQKKCCTFSPSISIQVPSCRFVIDPRQLEVIKELAELFTVGYKRSQQLLRARGIFGRSSSTPVPRINQIGGCYILPHLCIAGRKFPMEVSVPCSSRFKKPVASAAVSALSASSGSVGPPLASPPRVASFSAPAVQQGSSLAAILKVRLGQRWIKEMWRFAVRIVLEDLRRVKPLGRWFELCRLSLARKKYSFMYSKLLRKSKTTGNIVVNVHANVDTPFLLKLFEFEMLLPVNTILLFRSYAHIICTVEAFNTKRRQGRNGPPSSNGANTLNLQIFDKTNISWNDIIRIHSELIEAQRNSAMTRNRPSQGPEIDVETGTVLGLGDSANDDTQSVRSNSHWGDDTASVSSSAVGGRSSIARTINVSPVTINSTSSNNNNPAVTEQSTPAAAAEPPPLQSSMSYFSRLASGTSSAKTSSGSGAATRLLDSVKSVTAMNSAMKMFSGLGMTAAGGTSSSSSSWTFDDLDSKLFGRSEMSAFTEMFGNLFEAEDKARDNVPVVDPSGADGAHVVTLRGMTAAASMTVFDWQLGGVSPSAAVIYDAVAWGMIRHQPSYSIVPPEVTVTVDNIELSLRMPIEIATGTTSRANLATLGLSKTTCNLTIAQSVMSMNSKTSDSAGVAGDAEVEDKTALPPPVKCLGTFISLYGCLIQLRLSVSKASLTLNVHNPQLASAINGVKDSFTETANALHGALPVYKIGSVPTEGTPDCKHTEDIVTGEVEGDNEEEEDEDDRAGGYSDNESVSTGGRKSPPPTLGFDNTEGLDCPTPSDAEFLDDTEELRSIPVKPLRVLTSVLLDKARAQAEIALEQAHDELKEGTGEGDRGGDEEVHGEVAVQDQDGLLEEPSSTAVVFHSSETDTLFVACVMLDYDMKGEGSADLQIHLGSCEFNLAGNALSCLIDSTAMANAARASEALQVTNKVLAVLCGRALLVDLQTRQPVVTKQSVVCNEAAGPNSRPGLVGSDKMMAWLQRKVTGTSEQAMRQAMLDHWNFEQWRSAVQSYLPRALTLCARAAPVRANLLLTSTIRDLISFQAKLKADRVMSRVRQTQVHGREASDVASMGLQQAARLALGDGMSLLSLMNDPIQWATISKSITENCLQSSSSSSSSSSAAVKQEQSSVALEAMELVLVKAASPSSCVELRALGMSARVPVSDDSICQALAMLLAHFAPIYL